MKLINKDTLVAEIERLAEVCRNNASGFNEYRNAKYWGGVLSCLREVKIIIDTLEVKEVDSNDAFIEKACEWIETNMDDYIHVEYDTVTGKPTNEAHIAHKKVVEDFVKYMKGE